MTAKILDSERLRSLSPEMPDSFDNFVKSRLHGLLTGKEIPPVKKKMSLGLVIALVLALTLGLAAVAAVLSPAADVFGLLYGPDKKKELLAGDIASVVTTYERGDLLVTLDDVIYQPEGIMKGLYGTGTIRPRDGQKLVLIPEDMGPDAVADYSPYYREIGKEGPLQDDALSYREVAAARGAKMVVVRAFVEEVEIAGKPVVVDAGYSLLPMPDGGVRFAFETAGEDMRRVDEYLLHVYMGWFEVDDEGNPGDLHQERWTVTVNPKPANESKSLSPQNRHAVARASSPLAATEAKPVKLAGSIWRKEDMYMLENPGKQVVRVTDEDNLRAFLTDPNNAWDVGIFFLQDADIKPLMAEGRLYDLSQVPELAEVAGDTAPRAIEVLSQDGKLLGLPTAIFSANRLLQFAKPDILNKVGMTAADSPRTFKELCALAERYMALDLKTRRGTRFMEGDSLRYTKRLLLEQLIELSYFEDIAQGGTPSFDSPAFREGLMQLAQAAKALKGKQAVPDEKGNTYLLVHDAGPAPSSRGLMPLSMDGNPVFPMRLEVVVVNAKSDNLDEALHFVRYLAKNPIGQFLTDLNMVMPVEDIVRYSAERNIRERELENVGAEDIPLMKEWLENGFYLKHAHTEEELAAYRQDIAPHLLILTEPYTVFHAQMEAYLSGKLTDDAFIAALDKQVKEPQVP